LEANVAFVPGRAAYLDGRGGSELRLNFSGVGEDDIREGIRRIGEVVREQVALYGTLTGTHPVVSAPGQAAAYGGRSVGPAASPGVGEGAPAGPEPELAPVLRLRRKRA
jgi:hypothetical protein